MSHPARGSAQAGIGGKANVRGGRWLGVWIAEVRSEAEDSHPARGLAQAGIDGKANGRGGRRLGAWIAEVRSEAEDMSMQRKSFQ